MGRNRRDRGDRGAPIKQLRVGRKGRLDELLGLPWPDGGEGCDTMTFAWITASGRVPRKALPRGRHGE
jgi:hypothetical protein